jgi:hypothetical protein
MQGWVAPRWSDPSSAPICAEASNIERGYESQRPPASASTGGGMQNEFPLQMGRFCRHCQDVDDCSRCFRLGGRHRFAERRAHHRSRDRHPSQVRAHPSALGEGRPGVGRGGPGWGGPGWGGEARGGEARGGRPGWGGQARGGEARGGEGRPGVGGCGGWGSCAAARVDRHGVCGLAGRCCWLLRASPSYRVVDERVVEMPGARTETQLLASGPHRSGSTGPNSASSSPRRSNSISSHAPAAPRRQ